MSRAITFRFGESAQFRMMMEQELNHKVCADIKGGIETITNHEIKANMNSIYIEEMQIDLADIPGIDGKIEGFPQIRYSKEGVMTFIEIIIPNSSNTEDLDIQHAPVSENILTEESVTPAIDKVSERNNIVDFENITLDVPDLVEFSLEPKLRDIIKSLESRNEDFSLQAIESASDIPKSLPSHEDLMDFNDLMSTLRKKKKVKVKAKTCETKN